MSTSWEPVRQPRTHELVLERIEEQVMAGDLHAGERLPGERQLAAALGVSRSAVREALRIMEAFGLLTAHTGRGPDSGAVVTTDPTEAVGRMLRLHLALGGYQLSDILEARVMLERASVADASLEPQNPRIDAAAQLVTAMDNPELTPFEFNELDTQFHVELASCSGNELIRTLTAAVRESIRPLVLNGFQHVPDWRETATTLQSQHRNILHLIRDRQPERAAQAIDDHIRSFHGKLATAGQATS
ncbi:FadR/GntR family transcriptional regulator [Flexivirga oryzae]|uniref:DNA-binding FadR family transcriptional regulator n=1 Tax=Flexivirga oryzae TaxID=1794944 RepID=A0A839N2Q9_9MICO|nr:FCD domain-containing protein [Flexivirga oryzae]MBB2892008.1 DNA-binding FadR family transcriptional regulator [Flexivirga oryzae]